MSSSTSGRDEHRRERGMAAVARIERRFSHQPMHAGLGAQPAVGIIADHADGRALDARDFAGALIDDFGLDAVRVGPLQIHAQQHRRPVLRLGAAGARPGCRERRCASPSCRETCAGIRAARLRRPSGSTSASISRGGRQVGLFARPIRAVRRHRSSCAFRRSRPTTTCSSLARSLPSSCARSGLSQMPGCSSSRVTSCRRSCLLS